MLCPAAAQCVRSGYGAAVVVLAVLCVRVFLRRVVDGRRDDEVAGRCAVRLDRRRLDGVRKWKPIDVLIHTTASAAVVAPALRIHQVPARS